MSKAIRSILALSTGLVLASASACAVPSGSEAGGEPTEGQKPKALKKFDPCTFFTEDELTGWNVSTEGEPSEPTPSEPGCKWDGEKMDIGIHKNLEDTIDTKSQNEVWESFETKEIAGRSAAIGVSSAVSMGGGCNGYVDAGGGVVMYQATSFDEGTDTCGQVEDMMEQTADRLPQ